MEKELLTLKDCRVKTGMSQEDFARAIGMKYGTYVKKELYLRGLTAQELLSISDISNVSVRKIKLK